MDALLNVRRLESLDIFDDSAKEAVYIVVDDSITADQVVRILEPATQFHGLPAAIHTDQGPELTSRVPNQCAYRNGVDLKLIEPSWPTQNAYVESFNGKFQDK